MPEGITLIGDRAFRDCSSIISISIPEGVVSIGSWAFMNCCNLKSITLPKSLKEIGTMAFKNCHSLECVEGLCGGVSIMSQAFWGCESLADSKGYVNIGGILHQYFGSAQEVVIPDNYHHIGANAFQGCETIKSIRVPESVLTIGPGAFDSCKNLEEVNLPNTLSEISVSVFSDCPNLRTIKLPSTIKQISKWCFYKSGITSITIPEGVQTVGANAFYRCENLIEILLPNGLTSIGDDAFWGCTSLSRVDIPDSVSCIGWSSFKECSSLQHVTLPQSLEKIGEDVFEGCDALSEITVSQYLPIYSQLLKGRRIIRLYTKDQRVPSKYRLAAALGFIRENKSVKTSSDAKNVMKYLSKNALSLREIAWQEPELLDYLCDNQLIGIVHIDAFIDYAAQQHDSRMQERLELYKESLSSGRIEKSRDKLEKAKLARKARTEEALAKGQIAGIRFVVSGKLSTWSSAQELKDYLVQHGASLDSAVTEKTDFLVAEDSTIDLDKLSKARLLDIPIITEEELNYLICRRFRDAESVVVPNWLTVISEKAFADNKLLKKVSIPEGVKSIGHFAFNHCEQLLYVELQRSITSIG